jgi:carbamate kinase
MKIVAALGGNALLERGEAPESDPQETHVIKAVQALAPLAAEHDLVITHGNGPQVGLLALESAHDPALSRPSSSGPATTKRRRGPWPPARAGRSARTANGGGGRALPRAH